MRFCINWWRSLSIICLYALSTAANANANCILQPQHADSYILALSFQPGFCLTKGYNHQECVNLDQNYRHSFTLHGLWPNQKACNKKYTYCGNTPANKPWCSYQPLNLESSVSFNFKNIMPGYKYGSCLERYEWYKHGTCQSLSANDYYAMAINFTVQINHSYAVKLLKTSSGGYINKSEFIQAFERSFGNGSSNKIRLLCTNGILTDLNVNLPKIDKNSNARLIDLLKQSMAQEQGNCPDKIKIVQ